MCIKGGNKKDHINLHLISIVKNSRNINKEIMFIPFKKLWLHHNSIVINIRKQGAYISITSLSLPIQDTKEELTSIHFTFMSLSLRGHTRGGPPVFTKWRKKKKNKAPNRVLETFKFLAKHAFPFLSAFHNVNKNRISNKEKKEKLRNSF